MIDRLADLHPNEFGGFRIEISLVAKTLGEAKQKALRLPFFKLENWRHEMNHWKASRMRVSQNDIEGFDFEYSQLDSDLLNMGSEDD